MPVSVFKQAQQILGNIPNVKGKYKQFCLLAKMDFFMVEQNLVRFQLVFPQKYKRKNGNGGVAPRN